MMKSIDKQEVLEQYISSCQIIWDATLSGDYKTNNSEGKKIIKVFKMFEKNLIFAEECLSLLILNDNVVVKSKAAAHFLALNMRVEDAISTLELVASNEENGIFGFNAEMTLKVWREQGTLKVYQK